MHCVSGDQLEFRTVSIPISAEHIPLEQGGWYLPALGYAKLSVRGDPEGSPTESGGDTMASPGPIVWWQRARVAQGSRMRLQLWCLKLLNLEMLAW